MQTVTVKLPPELSARLNRRARELNRPKSEIIRKALKTELEGGDMVVSLLDRARDLAGKYASGRKDSSNKRHLKTLGFKRAGRWKHS